MSTYCLTRSEVTEYFLDKQKLTSFLRLRCGCFILDKLFFYGNFIKMQITLNSFCKKAYL